MQTPPNTEQELSDSVQTLAGLTIGQCAIQNDVNLPANLRRQKGWLGQLLEKSLGADAKSKPEPDFTALNIELKTLPIGKLGMPSESTFVASIPMKTIARESWETSTVKKKLNRVLWIPIESDKSIPLSQRRIGQGFIWSPSQDQENLLKTDWQELTDLIVLGKIDSISAKLGQVLQVRPKAANGKVLTEGTDSEGNTIKTLPRGFYLRTLFTKTLLE